MKKSRAEKDRSRFNKYRSRLAALAAECARLNIRGGSLAKLDALEQDCIALLKKSHVYLRFRTSYDYMSGVANDQDKIYGYLDTVRRRYIARFCEKHGCELDADELLDIPKKKLHEHKVQDIVFKKLVAILIPAHPRDEFPQARQMRRHFVIHSGATNTGKTYHALQALMAAGTGVYLAPLRLLALQVFHALNEGGVPCTLSTGEEDIITPGSKHISSTIEKLDIDCGYEVAVIDEAQMLGDRQRGNAWTRAILGVIASEVHVCCQPNAVNLVKQLIISCDDTYTVNEYQRDTALVFEENDFTFPAGVQRGDALIAFSKRMVLAISSALAEQNIESSVIYGNLPPETRRNQMKAFLDGETDVVVSTDAIGMGLNLPIKRVVFMAAVKFDGENENLLRPNEVKQIAGRAGRKGIYDIGYVNSIEHRTHIETALNTELGDLTKAYYLPEEEHVLNLPVGTLQQRIVACLNARNEVTYLNRTDIEQPLLLLGKIDKMPLTMRDKYKLIFIPFDAQNHGLLHEWLDYIKSYLGGVRKLRMPRIFGSSLDSLEQYYQSLDLYYSFSKTMSMPASNADVMRLKYETSAKIQELLKDRMKSMGKVCRRCRSNLPWDHPFGLCEKCFRKQHGAGYGPQIRNSEFGIRN